MTDKGDNIEVILSPNAMVFVIMEGNKMTGSTWFYDTRSQVAILLHREPATLANPYPPLSRGNYIAQPVEKDELNSILLHWGKHGATKFIIEGGITINVVAILKI